MEARTANDRIAEKARRLHVVSRIPMLCECGAPGCRAIVMVGLDDHRRLRRDDGVLLAPGHSAEAADPDGGNRTI